MHERGNVVDQARAVDQQRRAVRRKPAGGCRDRTFTRSKATTTIPATWTTAIAGIATRFSRRPAAVTREKTPADTGSRTSSTASDATIDATSHVTSR